MVRSPLLERFDDLASDPHVPGPPSDDWQAGHAAGLAEAESSLALKQTVLRDALVQSVADIDFHFAEARAHLLGSLGPLFRAIADGLIPGLIQPLLVARIAADLQDAAARDLSRPIHICLSPDDLPAVERAVTGLHMPKLRLTADGGLAPGQACLMAGAAETVLDVPALISAIRAALDSLARDSDQRSKHG
jgi:hypothetical protein